MNKREQVEAIKEAMREAARTNIVSRAQFKRALLAANKLAQFKTALAAASDATQIAFQDAQFIKRNSPAVAEIATAMSLTNAQVDNFFAAAAAIGD